MALATCLVAVWVKAFDDITVARATCGVSPPASGTRLVNPREKDPGSRELPLTLPCGIAIVALLTLAATQPSVLRAMLEIGSGHLDLLLHALVHSPGLTVWPKVILEALADVAVGGTELSGTHGLMLTWVQITHISTVVTIVTWDQMDGRGSIPTLPCTFFKPAFAQLLPLLSYSFVVQETRLREVT